MFGLRKTLSTIFLLVAFFVLASLASFIYTSDQKAAQSEVADSWWKKGGAIISTIFRASGDLAEVNLQKNIGPGKSWSDKLRDLDLRSLVSGETVDPFSEIKEKAISVKDKDLPDYQNLAAEADNLFNYRRTDEGGEIVFTSKSGEEYKLPLPFGFLKD